MIILPASYQTANPKYTNVTCIIIFYLIKAGTEQWSMKIHTDNIKHPEIFIYTSTTFSSGHFRSGRACTCGHEVASKLLSLVNTDYDINMHVLNCSAYLFFGGNLYSVLFTCVFRHVLLCWIFYFKYYINTFKQMKTLFTFTNFIESTEILV